MLHRSRRVLAVLVVTLLLGSCGEADSGTAGDCNARIRYEGTVYRPHTALNEAAPGGGGLGSGEVVGCGQGASAKRVDTVRVHSVKGVPATVAIKALRGEWAGIYVAEGLPRSDRPGALRRPSSPPAPQ